MYIKAQKLGRVRENNNFFRSKLQKMGFDVLGDNDSHVMPIKHILGCKFVGYHLASGFL